MSIRKNTNGSIVIGDFVNGYWFSKMYIYYTKREAIQLFRKEVKEMKRSGNKVNDIIN